MTRLDIVIFGATGFTGKRTALEMIRLSKKYPALTWGVAGRSQNKIDDLKQELTQKSGEDQSNLKSFLADVGDEKSLKAMCENAKVIVNCCGPYRLYGEPVVKAAIEAKTHHVDVSGEPEFMESMQVYYNDQAAEAGVFIISACGFDSIPCDLGVVYLSSKFDGVLNSVEAYLTTTVTSHKSEAAKYGVLHYGTWESVVHGVSNSHVLAPLRKKLYPTSLPPFKPKICRKLYHKKDGFPCLPFPGSDESIVYRTQRHLYDTTNKRPAQFKAYVSFPNILVTVAFALGAILLFVMSKWRITRQLLLDYPRVFSGGMASKEGPSDNVMENTKFQFKLFGTGWDGDDVSGEPNKKMAVKVSGTNPGYGATVTALLLSAITILNERNKMPQRSGVMTTGVAFKDTNIIKELNDNDLKFEVIEEN